MSAKSTATSARHAVRRRSSEVESMSTMLGEKYRARFARARSASVQRRRASRSTASSATAFLIVASRSAKSMGFSTNSKASRFIAVRMLATSP